MIHGNAKKNPNLHHLYDIFYHADHDIFKYGISDDPIGKDGLSTRAREQMEEANLAADYDKFGAEILLTDIPGRAEALRIEREHIDAYYFKYGETRKATSFLPGSSVFYPSPITLG